MCKIIRTDDNRILRKTMEWSSRRRKGWVASTNKIIAEIDTDNLVRNRNISTKTAVKRLSEKLYDIDKRQWREEIFKDRNWPNGNKLRTYRTYKQELCAEAYVTVDIPRNHRRTLAQFRAGSLPLAIETGRFAKPPIPLHERSCKYCTAGVVEDEKHFLMQCELYNDLRVDIFYKASLYIPEFNIMNDEEKFLHILTYQSFQSTLAYFLFKFYSRRKIVYVIWYSFYSNFYSFYVSYNLIKFQIKSI